LQSQELSNLATGRAENRKVRRATLEICESRDDRAEEVAEERAELQW
jgi:hypothetical protein